MLKLNEPYSITEKELLEMSHNDDDDDDDDDDNDDDELQFDLSYRTDRTY